MKELAAIPSLLSSLRIIALPLFVILYNQENVVLCLVLLAFCAISDFFDGYVARKLKVISRFGGYFDAFTDFILTGGIFAFYYSLGFYPLWLPTLIAVSFGLFLVTGFYYRKLYDPVGKYLGSALYIGIVLTLIWPIQPIFDFVQYAFVGFFLVSIASRIVSLTRKRKNI